MPSTSTGEYGLVCRNGRHSQCFSPKLAMLFTGAAEPRGRFRMTMASNDALEAANAFPGAAIVAVHNEGWTHLKQTAAIGCRIASAEPRWPSEYLIQRAQCEPKMRLQKLRR